MLTMRLMRFGTKKKPTYRIVVLDKRKAPQCKALDTIGTYNPITDPAEVKIDRAKADAWLAKGVQPSRTVLSLLHKTKKTQSA